MHDEQVDLDDLVQALVNARRWANAHPDLAGYYRQRYDLLTQALRAPDLLAENYADDRHLARLATDAVDHAARSSHPFQGMLEADSALVDLYQEHRDALQDLVAQRRSVNMAIIRSCLIQLEPGLEDQVTTEAHLIESGLPPSAPDEIDYL